MKCADTGNANTQKLITYLNVLLNICIFAYMHKLQNRQILLRFTMVMLTTQIMYRCRILQTKWRIAKRTRSTVPCSVHVRGIRVCERMCRTRTCHGNDQFHSHRRRQMAVPALQNKHRYSN